VDLFAFVYTIGCVFGVRGGLQESFRVGLEVLLESFHLRLVRIRADKSVHELFQFETKACEKVGCLLFIGHVADLIIAPVYIATNRD
jgi:hypothetical protein